MLCLFVQAHHVEILTRARLRVSGRNAPSLALLPPGPGLALFLSQLCASLSRGGRKELADYRDIEESARAHGEELFDRGVTVAQVVHDYGDLSQVITELAIEQQTAISAAEFRVLDRCLDEAIAGAMTAYAEHRERRIADDEAERIGSLAQEMEDAVKMATFAFASIKQGVVAPSGSTGILLEQNLRALQAHIDSTVADMRSRRAFRLSSASRYGALPARHERSSEPGAWPDRARRLGAT